MMGGRVDRRLEALSILLATVPFLFALIRAVNTGTDFRYFWLATASFGGAMVVLMVATSTAARLMSALAWSAAVFFAATVLALSAALLLGTTLNPGVLVVASSFGCCFAVSSLFRCLARRS